MPTENRGLSVVVLLLASAMAWPTLAGADPVSGPHETVDSRLTTTQPGAPTGSHFTGSYHAAGNPSADPPYMRRMVFYNPPGLRIDTSVPDRCTASDLALATMGASACPAGSRIGGGTATAVFMGQKTTLPADILNNENEQIIIVRSPFVASVSRGRINPDGSIAFASPTCFPALPQPACPDDVLQLGSDMSMPTLTRMAGGLVRSYLTTPPACPVSGDWETPIRFWWADGTTETVTTHQPCTRPATARHRPRHRKRARRARSHENAHAAAV
ncbi:MAG: hypothetical protein ACJ76Z_11335 [Thermoleophilaceae bacterium]